MTKITYALMVLIAISAITSVYATSDWRIACAINNPLDNLECAVDHIEGELNNTLSTITALDTKVTQNEVDILINDGRITTLENLPSGNEIHGTYLVFADQSVQPNTSSFKTVFCDEGDLATGGGYVAFPSVLEVQLNSPDTSSNEGWIVQARHDGSGTFSANFTVLVVCLDLETPHTP